jgi:hypothetical protein
MSCTTILSKPPQTKLPHLVVSDILAAAPLISYFAAVYTPDALPANPQGHYIISLDPDTPERLWRAIAHKLMSAGCEVSICEVGFVNNQPLEWYLGHTPIQQAVQYIITQDIPYVYWLESLNDKGLPIREAVEIAEDILKLEPDSPKRNIALEVLRRRTGVSEWSWDRKYLDSIRAKLEQSFTLGSSKTKISDTKERLRLDILALLKEDDPIDYEVARIDIQSRYRLNNKALERIICSIGQRTKESEVEDLGLDELFDLPTDNIEYIIPGMLPVGEAALLIANPKAGKSLVAYDAAFAVATGEDTFLGEHCKQGKVLIVQCDESKATAKGRLLKRGFRREDASNVRFMHKFSITQLRALEEILEAFRPTLVVIDSLRRINAGREISENSAEFADYIYQLKELCARYNAALILIHHSNKNSEAVGVEKVRGSSAIAGAVWGVWELSQVPKPDPNNKKKLIIDPKDPHRILSVIARDVEGQRLKIELDPENNHWINHGQQGISEEEVKEQKSHAAKVIELLKSVAPVGLETSEINEKLGIGRGIHSVLSRLLGQKIIGCRPSEKDRRRTVWFCSTGTQQQSEDLLTVTHQQDDNPPPPTDTDPNVIEYAEPIDISSVQSSITFDHNLIAFDHIPLADPWDEQASNPETESDTAYSITSAHSGWGRGQKPPEHVTVDSSELSHTEPTFVDQTITSADEENILDLAELLQLCDSKEGLQEIRQISAFTPAILNQACKCLSPEKHNQIKTWVVELNQALKVGDRVNWENCPAHCEQFAPFEIMSLDGDYAKLDLFEKLVPLAELNRA